MKNNLVVIILFLLTLNTHVYGQELREYIGTPDRSEVILDTKGMPDGGAVMVGYSTVLDISGNYDYRNTDLLVLRVDAAGNVMWNRRMGVTGLEDMFKRVIIASNGDVIAAGYVGHIPWAITSPTVGYGAVYRLDVNTGATNWSNFVTNPTTNQNDKGSVYEDVIELDNGEIVCVGARDAQPAWSDGMVTKFDANLNLIWNRTYNIGNTDDNRGVTQQNNRIFVAGGHYAGSYYDMNLVEFNTAGSIVWSKSYTYTLNNPELGLSFTNNTPEEIKVVNNELYIVVSASNNWGSTSGNMSGIMRTDLSGVFQTLKPFNDYTYNYSGLASADYLDANNAYYVINPGFSAMNLHAPVTGPLVVSDALLGIVDPVTGSISDTRRLVHSGNQSLLGVNLLGTSSFYAGTSENDPAQIGALDVFFVKGVSGLPHNHADCEAIDGQLSNQNEPTTETSLPITPDQNWLVGSPHIDEQPEALEVVVLCYEACEIQDITFCGSWANPLTYTFNVTTNPAVANVVWDFGDATLPVSSTSGTPVVHTYASGGSYTVCVDLLDASGEVCTTQCITICVPDKGKAKAGKSSASSSVIPVKTQNTVVGELYPNPTDGSLNIPITTSLNSSDVSIRIIRMDGVVVHDSKTTIENGKQILKIELNSLTPGNYMCEVRNGEMRSVKMFTKN